MHELVPVTLGITGDQPVNALFKLRPVVRRPNTQQLTRLVYRAIRMGWRPDPPPDWFAANYICTLDCLPANMHRDDFQAFFYQHQAMLNRIARNLRLYPTEFLSIYQRIKDTHMNTELTDSQIEHQDEVDNLIHEALLEGMADDEVGALVIQLVETVKHIPVRLSAKQIEAITLTFKAEAVGYTVWNIENIATVREAIRFVVVDELQLMIEQDFYPYLED